MGKFLSPEVKIEVRESQRLITIPTKYTKKWTVPTWWSRWQNTQSSIGINSLCPCNKSTVLTNIFNSVLQSWQWTAATHMQSAPVTYTVLTIGHEWNRTQFLWMTQHTDVYPRQHIHQSVSSTILGCYCYVCCSCVCHTTWHLTWT